MKGHVEALEMEFSLQVNPRKTVLLDGPEM